MLLLELKMAVSSADMSSLQRKKQVIDVDQEQEGIKIRDLRKSRFNPFSTEGT